MDRTVDAPEGPFSADVVFFSLLALAVSSVLVSLYFFLTDQNPIFSYSIAIPEQCLPNWQGQTLQQPELKVFIPEKYL